MDPILPSLDEFAFTDLMYILPVDLDRLYEAWCKQATPRDADTALEDSLFARYRSAGVPVHVYLSAMESDEGGMVLVSFRAASEPPPGVKTRPERLAQMLRGIPGTIEPGEEATLQVKLMVDPEDLPLPPMGMLEAGTGATLNLVGLRWQGDGEVRELAFEANQAWDPFTEGEELSTISITVVTDHLPPLDVDRWPDQLAEFASDRIRGLSPPEGLDADLPE